MLSAAPEKVYFFLIMTRFSMYSIAKKWGMCYFPLEHYSMENASLLYCRGRRLSYRFAGNIAGGDGKDAAGEQQFFGSGIFMC